MAANDQDIGVQKTRLSTAFPQQRTRNRSRLQWLPVGSYEAGSFEVGSFEADELSVCGRPASLIWPSGWTAYQPSLATLLVSRDTFRLAAFLCRPHDDGLGSLQGFHRLGPITRRDSVFDRAHDCAQIRATGLVDCCPARNDADRFLGRRGICHFAPVCWTSSGAARGLLQPVRNIQKTLAAKPRRPFVRFIVVPLRSVNAARETLASKQDGMVWPTHRNMLRVAQKDWAGRISACAALLRRTHPVIARGHGRPIRGTKRCKR